MSQPGGFTFTSTPGANEYVANPCYQVNIVTPLTSQVQTDCRNLALYYHPLQNITASPT